MAVFGEFFDRIFSNDAKWASRPWHEVPPGSRTQEQRDACAASGYRPYMPVSGANGVIHPGPYSKKSEGKRGRK